MTSETEARLIELANELLHEVRSMRIMMQENQSELRQIREDSLESEEERKQIRPAFYKRDEPEQ